MPIPPAMDTSKFLWRPFGVTDAELMNEWPYVFRNILTRPIGFPQSEGILLRTRRDLARDTPAEYRPLLRRIVDIMLQHIEAHRAAPPLQARIRCFCAERRRKQIVTVLGALHPRSESLLGLMLGRDMLWAVLRML